MGIYGLTKYVDKLPFGEGQVWESYDLHHTNLIIDGCGLYYYIYGSKNLNIQFGGQYQQFQNLVKNFFAKLRSSNIVPYVVLDGIMDKDEKKFHTSMKRKAERIKQMGKLWTSKEHGCCMVLPRLAEMAFVQVLQEIKVPYAVADFEADCEIALLANNLRAPVMANDSDFYIFNIKHGYIPFQQYDFSGPNIRVKKFSFSAFARHLGIDPEMSPLLASLIGNDYISDIMLTPFKAHIQNLVSSSELKAGGEKCNVPTIAQFLSKYESVSIAFDAVIGLFPESCKSAFEKALRLSTEEYQGKQSNLIGYLHSGDLRSTMCTYNGHPIPQWLTKLNREGLFAAEGWACLCNRKIFLQTQSEDTSLPSAQTCVRELRWHYYALAMNCENAMVLGSESHQPRKAGLQSMEACTTESGSQQQRKTGLLSKATGQTELQPFYDHTLTRQFTPDSDHALEIEPGPHPQSRAKSHYLSTETTKNTILVSHSDPTEIKSPHPAAISDHFSSENNSDDTFTIKFDLHIEEPTDTTTSKVPLNNKAKTDINDSTTNEVTLPKDGLITTDGTMTIDQVHENAMKSGLPTNSDDHTTKDVSCGRNDGTPQASNFVTDIERSTEEIIVTEFDREGSTLAHKKVNLTVDVAETEIQIHDIPNMSDDVKRTHLLNLLNSNLPFIHRLPVNHQLVVSALRYWVSHAKVKEAHLAALLVHYVDEKRGPKNKDTWNNVSLEAVHGFSQWQNVLYWVQRFNSLFLYIFPQLQVASLYDGVRVCLVYERIKQVKLAGNRLAESIATNTSLYRQLYDAATRDLPRDCHFNQSRSRQRQNKGSEKPEQGKHTTSKSKECLKGNKFAVLCEESDSDEDWPSL